MQHEFDVYLVCPTSCLVSLGLRWSLSPCCSIRWCPLAGWWLGTTLGDEGADMFVPWAKGSEFASEVRADIIMELGLKKLQIFLAMLGSEV